MSWTSLSFLAEPWFVLPWYAIGGIGAAAVAYDLAKVNTPLKTAMKWAWPIIVFFFSVLGILLYLTTARAPNIGERDDKKQAHEHYERNTFRRVNGSVIHCVAGDGIGIVTAMVIARVVRLSPWQEFWFEYVVGFAVGLFVFQRKSMKMMTDSTLKALAMAFRAEFFSMLTVMAGMGAVMMYVTPMVVTAQPRPLTFAFWGFAMLGLLAGYVATYPMNLMLVKIGWKHGMGSKDDARPVQSFGWKLALGASMVVLGFGALLVPGLLMQARARNHVDAAVGPQGEGSLDRLRDGLRSSVAVARSELKVNSTGARVALDAAHRAAEVADAAAHDSTSSAVLARVKGARRDLWMGRRDQARSSLALATALLDASVSPTPQRSGRSDFADATVLDVQGNIIGELRGHHGSRADVELGGIHDFWGFIDVNNGRSVSVPETSLIYGPSRRLGPHYVVLADPDIGQGT